MTSTSMAEPLDGTVWIGARGRIVHFERRYAVTAARLWAAITQPDLVAGWLGPVEKFDLVIGGEVTVLLHPARGAWLRGRISRLDIPRSIELTWTVPAHGSANESTPAFTGSTLQLDVRSEGAGSRLVFAHALPDAARVLDILAASHLRLRQLPSAVGQQARVNREEFLAMRARYEKRMECEQL